MKLEKYLTPRVGLTYLYMAGSFKEETKPLLVTQGSVIDVPNMESTSS